MRTKPVILITILIPVLILGAILSVGIFRDNDEEIQPLYSYNEIRSTVYGEDGTILPTLMGVPEKMESKKVAFLVSDRGLDGNWNSRGLSFNTGEALARNLTGQGIVTVRYDRRGTGGSRISGRNYPDLDNGASDLHAVYNKVMKEYESDTPVSFIAHGDGCMETIYAINKYSMNTASLILIGCAYEGTLLENWGNRLILNMEKSRVDEKYLKHARMDLKQWVEEMTSGRDSEQNVQEQSPSGNDQKDNEISSGKMHPDLIAYYRALEHMESPEMISWTKQAAHLNFQNETSAILKKGIKIYQFVGRFDEEIPQESVQSNEKLAREFQSRNMPYFFTLVDDADHFMKVRHDESSSTMETVFRRMSPIQTNSKKFFQNIVASVQ